MKLVGITNPEIVQIKMGTRLWNGKHCESDRRASMMVQEGKILRDIQFI